MKQIRFTKADLERIAEALHAKLAGEMDEGDDRDQLEATLGKVHYFIAAKERK